MPDISTIKSMALLSKINNTVPAYIPSVVQVNQSLLFVSPFFLATPLLLASCATVSQYGVAASIRFETTNGAGTGGSSSGSKEGESMSGTIDPNYDTEFSKYHFD